jgi:hypothetical protein
MKGNPMMRCRSCQLLAIQGIAPNFFAIQGILGFELQKQILTLSKTF